MKQRLLELIGEYINNEKEKENFIKDIDELIFVWDENLLDIFPIVWENILMEVPMRVVSSDVSDVPLEGNGWKFIKED